MKAFEQVWKSVTGVPAVDLREKRYVAVNYKAGVDFGIDVATAKGNAIGILEDPNNIGQPAEVVASGFSFCLLGGTVTEGTALEVGADGKLVAHTDGVVVGTCVVGGADGDIGTVLLK